MFELWFLIFVWLICCFTWCHCQCTGDKVSLSGRMPMRHKIVVWEIQFPVTDVRRIWKVWCIDKVYNLLINFSVVNRSWLTTSFRLQQKQQSQLKQAMEASQKKSDDAQQAKKSLETRQQHDINVVEQLKAIVAEKETKIKSLELEVCQLRAVAVCRWPVDDCQYIVTRDGNRTKPN